MRSIIVPGVTSAAYSISLGFVNFVTFCKNKPVSIPRLVVSRPVVQFSAVRRF